MRKLKKKYGKRQVGPERLKVLGIGLKLPSVLCLH